jgi:hypothetical protein
MFSRFLVALMVLPCVVLGCGEGGDADSPPKPPEKEEILEHIMGTWVAEPGSAKDFTFIFVPNGDRTMTQTINGHTNVSDGLVTKERRFPDRPDLVLEDEAHFFVFGSDIKFPNFEQIVYVVKLKVYEINSDTMRARFDGDDYVFKKQ